MINNILDNWNRICIYKLTNKINGKIYIGETKNLYNRLNNYKNSKTSGYISEAIKKYGWDNFEYQILEDVDYDFNLRVREQYYIEKYNSTDKNIGYNKNKGFGQRPIICLTTNKIYNNLNDIYRSTGININKILKCIKGLTNFEGNLPDGTKLVWRYYEKT